MVWGLYYKLILQKIHRLADRLPTKKTASQLTVDLVLNKDNNQSSGHLSLGKFFFRLKKPSRTGNSPHGNLFFSFFKNN